MPEKPEVLLWLVIRDIPQHLNKLSTTFLRGTPSQDLIWKWPLDNIPRTGERIMIGDEAEHFRVISVEYWLPQGNPEIYSVIEWDSEDLITDRNLISLAKVGFCAGSLQNPLRTVLKRLGLPS